MKFVKGMLIGSMVTAGVAMIYAENMGFHKNPIMKKGKNLLKKWEFFNQ